MLIKTEIDVSGALSTLDLILKKVPFATNNALTRTAKEVVDVERAELAKDFTERTQFIPKRVQILKYSRVGDLWTRIGINRDVQGSPLLLTMFEDGGAKEPELGSDIGVPITGGAARPAFSQKVTSSLLYQKLQLQPVGPSGQIKGLKRAFVIPGIGVFQRTNSRQRQNRAKKGVAAGRGKDPDLVLLYAFEPSAPLGQRMHFVATARDYVAKRFGVIWREEFVRELAGRAR